jgi:hypothetical protein
VRPDGFLLPFGCRRSLLGHPVLPAGIPPPLLSAYRGHRAYPRMCTADPGRVYTFRTRETRTGPGALCTPRTAVFTGHRRVRGRRLPPHNGWSLASRHNHPTRDVILTRHTQEFPVSRPVPVLPLACDRPGWDSGPWAFP